MTTLASLLGWTNEDITGNATYRYQFPFDTYIIVYIENIGSSSQDSNKITYKIPYDQASSTIYWSRNNQNTQKVYNAGSIYPFNRLNIKVFDRYGNPLSNNGVDWSFTLKIQGQYIHINTALVSSGAEIAGPLVTKNGDSFNCSILFSRKYVDVREVSLETAEIPVGFYNMRAPYNTNRIITVPPANYTINSLMNQLDAIYYINPTTGIITRPTMINTGFPMDRHLAVNSTKQLFFGLSGWIMETDFPSYSTYSNAVNISTHTITQMSFDTGGKPIFIDRASKILSSNTLATLYNFAPDMTTYSFGLPIAGFSGFAANSRGDIMFIDKTPKKMIRYTSGFSYNDTYFTGGARAITVDVDDRLYVFNTYNFSPAYTLDVYDPDMHYLWTVVNFSSLTVLPPTNIIYLTVTSDFIVYGVQNTPTFAVVLMNTGTVLNIPYLPTDQTCIGLAAVDSKYLVFTFSGDYNLYIWNIQ
jgi:hypothetical protein